MYKKGLLLIAFICCLPLPSIRASDDELVDLLCNLGDALYEKGLFSEARTIFANVLIKDSHNIQAHCGLGYANLALGDLQEGFKELEWHCAQTALRTSSITPSHFAHRAGKTILLHCNQRIEDTLQFIRYAQRLHQEGATVWAQVQPELIPLITCCCPYIDKVLSSTRMVFSDEIDMQLQLMSLPYLMNTTLQTIPAQIPYLELDQSLSTNLRAPSEKHKVLHVGINWHGSTEQTSIPSLLFAALADHPDIKLYNIEPITNFDTVTFPLDQRRNNSTQDAFISNAALIKEMDIVITADGPIAHLAGALGVKTWVLLPAVAEWRWMCDRDDSPWYPTVRLFRQMKAHDWRSVMQEVNETLASMIISRNAKPAPITAEIAIGELIDKITILEIKMELIHDKAKLQNIKTELDILRKTYDKFVRPSKELDELTAELLKQNKQLWVIEDAIRDKEQLKQFDAEFISLARSVYYTNDARCKAKRAINELLGSHLIEEKSYKDYAQAAI